jgi:hypothetical protein
MFGVAGSLGEPRPHLIPAPKFKHLAIVQDEHRVELGENI